MKILAAITNVYFLTFFKKRYRKRVPFNEKRVKSRTRKRVLVYDPKVTRWDYGKKVKDDVWADRLDFRHGVRPSTYGISKYLGGRGE
jgi:hypothetical protein